MNFDNMKSKSVKETHLFYKIFEKICFILIFHYPLGTIKPQYGLILITLLKKVENSHHLCVITKLTKKRDILPCWRHITAVDCSNRGAWSGTNAATTSVGTTTADAILADRFFSCLWLPPPSSCVPNKSTCRLLLFGDFAGVQDTIHAPLERKMYTNAI